MTNSNNPLKSHFRRPSIYITLPSNGKNWKENSLDMPINNSLPVYPMTAIDEISLRTPDGLFSGQSTIDVIQSCVPNIKNAWNIPTTDLDSILVAIRIASYGQKMEITSTCPNCKETNDYDFDLGNVVDSFTLADYDTPLVIDNVKFLLRPMTYKDITDNGILQVQEKKLYQINSDTTLSIEDKINQINDNLKILTNSSISAIAKSVKSISIDDNIANEQEHITEYLQNCPSTVFAKLREKITSLKEASEAKPLKIVCPECQHNYEAPFVLDLSSFFE